MKVAIFSDTFYPQTNGVAHFIINSAEGLARHGHEVRVLTVMSDQAKKTFNSLGYKFTVENIPSISVNFIYPGERFTLPLGWTLRKIKKFKPDIIHSHTPLSVGCEAVLIAKCLKIPIAGEHHTFYDFYLKHIKMNYRWAKKTSWRMTTAYYNKCNVVISPTQSLANDLIKSGLKKTVKIIPNGIDIDFFHPVSDEEKNRIKKTYGIRSHSLVYVGRISYEKNLAQLIKIFFLLIKNENMKDTKLMLVGDGPERKKLEALGRKLNLDKNIIWTGTLRGQTWKEAFSCNDIFVTASKSENMPLTVLEAMACGLPIVTADEKGLKEIIKENQNGYLCQIDNAGETAQKIKNILEDATKRERFGRASRELAMNYSKEKVTCLLEECYQKVINNYESKK
jgi:1,2-diacylglycerol 3-alpha-glucosyltransferase